MNNIQKLKQFKDKLENSKNSKKIKRALKSGILAMAIFTITFPPCYASYKKRLSHDEYLDILNDYNQHIASYAEEFKKEELSDLDIFMKIMVNDMDRFSVQYVDEIPIGYERLYLYATKSGDCANFADDMTAKLNQINPNYQANNLYVSMKDNSDSSVFNSSKIWTANHCVTAITINNTILILDPATMRLGTMKDGKIIMFGNEEELSIAPIYTYAKRGWEDFFSMLEKVKESYSNQEDIQKLNEMYGQEAQINSCIKVLHYDKKYPYLSKRK